MFKLQHSKPLYIQYVDVLAYCIPTPHLRGANRDITVYKYFKELTSPTLLFGGWLLETGLALARGPKLKSPTFILRLYEENLS